MSVHACQTCLELRCCPEHCCNWDDCDCGDCENCGGALPIELTSIERFERKQSSKSPFAVIASTASSFASAAPLFGTKSDLAAHSANSPPVSERQPCTRVLSVSLPRAPESELAITSLDDGNQDENIAGLIPADTILASPRTHHIQYVRLRSNDGREFLVPQHVCAVSTMLQSMLSGQRFLERQAVFNVDINNSTGSNSK
jgi:hypothetical protein